MRSLARAPLEVLLGLGDPGRPLPLDEPVPAASPPSEQQLRRSGHGRTGQAMALYRVSVQGWSREEAVQEMTQGPFDYRPAWRKVLQYVRSADVECLKRQAGL